MSAETPIQDVVPKLPRGRGLKLSGPAIFRILLTVITLVGVVFLTRPCADSVSGFVMGMDGSNGGSAGAAQKMPKPGTVDQPQQFEQLRPDMTEAELKAAVERAKARNDSSNAAVERAKAQNARGSGGAGSATPAAP